MLFFSLVSVICVNWQFGPFLIFGTLFNGMLSAMTSHIDDAGFRLLHFVIG